MCNEGLKKIIKLQVVSTEKKKNIASVKASWVSTMTE